MDSDNKKQLFLLKELAGTLTEIDLFEEVFYQFPDMIQSVNDQGLIVGFNAKACELLGYSPDELMGMSVYDIYAPEVREDLKKGFSELKELGQKNGIQSKIITKSRHIIDVEVRSLSLYDAKGNFVKTLSILRDMQELNHLRATIIQQSKLAAIGELAAGIMHDIRNPLSIIMNYNDMVPQLLEDKDYPRIQLAHEKIAKGCLRIERLSNHLREFSRSESEVTQEFMIKDLIEESLIMLETRIHQSGVQLENLLGTSSLQVVGRMNRLEQVIINLISNACDACLEARPKGGGIIRLSGEKLDDRIVLRVKDNGKGIKKEYWETVFEAFYTTKPKGKGTGLGLSICKGIVADQGGLLEVKSEYGSGAEFILSLSLDGKTPLAKKL